MRDPDPATTAAGPQPLNIPRTTLECIVAGNRRALGLPPQSTPHAAATEYAASHDDPEADAADGFWMTHGDFRADLARAFAAGQAEARAAERQRIREVINKHEQECPCDQFALCSRLVADVLDGDGDA